MRGSVIKSAIPESGPVSKLAWQQQFPLATFANLEKLAAHGVPQQIARFFAFASVITVFSVEVVRVEHSARPLQTTHGRDGFAVPVAMRKQRPTTSTVKAQAARSISVPLNRPAVPIPSEAILRSIPPTPITVSPRQTAPVETASALPLNPVPVPALPFDTPPPDPALHPAIEAPRPEPVSRILPSQPAPTPAAPITTFVGPKVIHQAIPAIPRGVGTMINTDVQVDVAVAVSPLGKVTSARVASIKGAAAGLLTIEALKAAQLFRFQPAQENGRSVASSIILTFHFGRKVR